MTSTPPPPRWVSATISKRGNGVEENEDSSATSPSQLRFAVADGATEAWESGAWAACLTKAFILKPPTPTDFPAWLKATQSKWLPRRESGPIPWFAEIKRDEGSFATLVGIEFHFNERAARWTWKAVAVGDSCMFHLRNGCLQQAFPISTAAGFGSRPQLVPSRAAVACPEPEWLAGLGQPLDLFLLATDAVAAHLVALTDPAGWLPVLAAVEKGLSTGDTAPLLLWLHTVQAAKNDDLTVVATRLPEPPA